MTSRIPTDSTTTDCQGTGILIVNPTPRDTSRITTNSTVADVQDAVVINPTPIVSRITTNSTIADRQSSITINPAPLIAGSVTIDSAVADVGYYTSNGANGVEQTSSVSGTIVAEGTAENGEDTGAMVSAVVDTPTVFTSGVGVDEAINYCQGAVVGDTSTFGGSVTTDSAATDSGTDISGDGIVIGFNPTPT